MKCKVCERDFELKIENKYITKHKLLFGPDTMYNTFDCTYCGCQHAVNVRLPQENPGIIIEKDRITITPDSKEISIREDQSTDDEPSAINDKSEPETADNGQDTPRISSGKFGKITEDQKKRIMELYKEGKTTNEIRHIVGCSYGAVWSYLKNHKLQPIIDNQNVKPPGLSVEQVKRVYIDENKSIVEAAKELGCEISILWNFIAKNKIIKDKRTFDGYLQHGDM